MLNAMTIICVALFVISFIALWFLIHYDYIMSDEEGHNLDR